MPVTYWLELLRRALVGDVADAFPTFAALSTLQLLLILAASTLALAAIAAMTFRWCDETARERGLIDRTTLHGIASRKPASSTLVYAFQRVARGWRTAEPEPLESTDDRGRWERPRRFERLCYRALAEGLISLTKAAELLRLPVSRVEADLKGPRADEDRRQ